MKLEIVKNSRVWFIFSGTLVAISIALVAAGGLKLGIEFTSGTLMELSFKKEVSKEEFAKVFTDNLGDLGENIVASENGFIVRSREISTDDQKKLDTALKGLDENFEIIRATSISPTIGKVFKNRAVRSLTYAMMAIILYIAAIFRDRKREESLLSYGLIGIILTGVAIMNEMSAGGDLEKWIVFSTMTLIFAIFIAFKFKNNPGLIYGMTAIIALIHDVIITTGVFALLGFLAGIEIDTKFVVALLTVTGFSVNDTIVVFDRLRENMKGQNSSKLAEVAEISLWQTMRRSVNTSLSTVIVLIALMLFGSSTLFYFVLALVVGISIGTYSSIFLATPLLVAWRNK